MPIYRVRNNYCRPLSTIFQLLNMSILNFNTWLKMQKEHKYERGRDEKRNIALGNNVYLNFQIFSPPYSSASYYRDPQFLSPMLTKERFL